VRRLAYLCTDPGVRWGGENRASVQLAEMAQALAEHRAEVLVIADGVEHGAAAPPPGVRLELLPGPGRDASEAELTVADARRTAWIGRRLERFGAEALYERIALPSASGSAAAAAAGIPHLVELNAPLPEEATRYGEGDQSRAAARLEATILRNAELVLAVTGRLAAYARRRGARRVKLFPNAVSLERFGARATLRGGQPVAVLAGDFRRGCGPGTLAAAWRLLGHDKPRLLVLGDGVDRELLDAGAEAVGGVPYRDVPELLAGAQIGLAVYDGGTPPYASPPMLLEYLAAGLAVVAAKLPAVVEVVDERSAVLVPPGHPAALAEAVAELARDPARRSRLGSAGRDLVRSRHTRARRARDVVGAACGLAEFQVACRPLAERQRLVR
jgi:glycosyltransferase involved in cell wall biosynthesis